MKSRVNHIDFLNQLNDLQLFAEGQVSEIEASLASSAYSKIVNDATWITDPDLTIKSCRSFTNYLTSETDSWYSLHQDFNPVYIPAGNIHDIRGLYVKPLDVNGATLIQPSDRCYSQKYILSDELAIQNECSETNYIYNHNHNHNLFSQELNEVVQLSIREQALDYIFTSLDSASSINGDFDFYRNVKRRIKHRKLEIYNTVIVRLKKLKTKLRKVARANMDLRARFRKSIGYLLSHSRTGDDDMILSTAKYLISSVLKIIISWNRNILLKFSINTT